MFNVIRTHPAPPSLAKKQCYRQEDVMVALNEIFFGKCYICETKDPLSINVEHFDAHMGDVDKKFDWNNLFFCCARCNNIKNANFNNLLNCTNQNIDVLRSIRHVFPVTPGQKKIVIEPKGNSEEIIETAQLIDKVFNDDSTGNRKVTNVSLKNKVFKRYAEFFKHVNIYIDSDKLQANRDEAFEYLKQMMKKEQEYSAFIRWAVLEDLDLCAKLEQYID